jgi:hypothetical protein
VNIRPRTRRLALVVVVVVVVVWVGGGVGVHLPAHGRYVLYFARDLHTSFLWLGFFRRIISLLELMCTRTPLTRSPAHPRTLIAH